MKRERLGGVERKEGECLTEDTPIARLQAEEDERKKKKAKKQKKTKGKGLANTTKRRKVGRKKKVQAKPKRINALSDSSVEEDTYCIDLNPSTIISQEDTVDPEQFLAEPGYFTLFGSRGEF